MSLQIRDAGLEDAGAIAAIYAPHVLHGSATFETVPLSANEMAARREGILAAGLPFLVAERDGEILGYAYAGPYRARPAYRHTVENSVYVREGSSHQGAGGALLAALVARCEAGPWRQMVAVIGDSANATSIALHARHGFRFVGTLEAVGFKHGRWVDTVLMQQSLGAGAGGDPPPPRS